MSTMVVARCGDRTADRKHGVCARFHFAVARGEMIPDQRRGGWVLTTLPLRELSPRAKYFRTEDGKPYDDHTGEPYLLTEFCPWCSGLLAPVAVVPIPQCDGWEL